MAFSLQNLYEPINLPRVDTTAIDKLLDEAIARYQPGGEFGKPELALLKREKIKTLAKQKAGLIGRGMAKTTVGAGLGKKWEEEIGMPAKLKLEDIRTQRLLQALQAKAGFMERAQAANLAAAQSEAQMRIQQQATEAGFRASELGAIAKVHGAGGGGRGAVDRAFWEAPAGGGRIAQAVAGGAGVGTHEGATAGAFGDEGKRGQLGVRGALMIGGQKTQLWGEEPGPAGIRSGDILISGAGETSPFAGQTITVGTPQHAAYTQWRKKVLARQKATARATGQSFRGAGYTGGW